MKKESKRQHDEEIFQAALQTVRGLAEKQRLRLLAQLQADAFRTDLPDLSFAELPDLASAGLPDLGFGAFPKLEPPEGCPFCGKRNRT